MPYKRYLFQDDLARENSMRPLGGGRYPRQTLGTVVLGLLLGSAGAVAIVFLVASCLFAVLAMFDAQVEHFDFGQSSSLSAENLSGFDSAEPEDAPADAQVAVDFARAFLSYDAASLDNGDWADAVADRCDKSKVESGKSNLLTTRFVDTKWRKAASAKGASASVSEVKLAGADTKSGPDGKSHLDCTVVVLGKRMADDTKFDDIEEQNFYDEYHIRLSGNGKNVISVQRTKTISAE